MTMSTRKKKKRAGVALATVVLLTIALIVISAIVGVALYASVNSKNSASPCPYSIPTVGNPSSSVQQSSSDYGYNVRFCVVTGPAPQQPIPLGSSSFYLYLQSIVIAGTCNLTGGSGNGGTIISGSSGECSIISNVTGTVVNATSDETVATGPSFCQADDISLGAAPTSASPSQDPLPVAWLSTGPNGSALVQYYNISTANKTGDFRIGWSNLLSPEGSNTFLCASYLFDGYSADLFVPAQAGLYNFTGTQGVSGTFLYYYANVTPLH